MTVSSDSMMELGEVSASASVLTLGLTQSRLEAILRVHARVGPNIHPIDLKADRLDGPRVIRSTHWCQPPRRGGCVVVDILTLILDGTPRTVMLMPEDGVDYGCVPMLRQDFSDGRRRANRGTLVTE